MKLNEFKAFLKQSNNLHFKLPDGKELPGHYHLTEIARVDKHFIDCGSTLRSEKKISMQLWHAEDLDHRLKIEKLELIIEMAEEKLSLENWDLQIEYQSETKGIYDLEFDGQNFLLLPTETDCLAKDKCGTESPAQKRKQSLVELGAKEEACCSPDSNCC